MFRTLVKTKRTLTLLLFLLPGLLLLFTFWIFPIFRSFAISFTDWDYMSPDYNIVGFENYRYLLQNADFYKAMMTTVLFGMGTVLPSLFLGMTAALLVHNLRGGSAVYRLSVFSPWVTPAVAVSMVWTWMYDKDNGILNSVLEFLGLGPCPWISDSKTALLSVVIVNVWKSMGYVMIFYIVALSKVPTQLYEAAGVDGAGTVKKFFHITWPSIMPTTSLVTVILTIQSLQSYDSIQILTQGGPAGSTRTLLYLYYQLAFEQFHMGQAAASVILLLLITLMMSSVQYLLSRRSGV